MTQRAISWDDAKGKSPRRRLAAATSTVALAALAALAGMPAATSAASSGASGAATVIVRGDGTDRAAVAIGTSGGTITRRLDIIEGYVATVPASSVASLRAAAGVASVTPDAKVSLASGASAVAGAAGSLSSITRFVGAQDAWAQGATGAGVDVALIDSGVSPVPGLDGKGKILNGADLSWEGQAANLRYVDAFGHGTHMAGIIAGRDAGELNNVDADNFDGVAPDARILNVKVADTGGATDVSQVIAAIDWVVQHRADKSNRLNIKVLNLSWGTNSTQPYTIDPLAYAATVAWKNGITVVAAVGNQGKAGVMDPATNPFVIAVAADDTKGTADPSDDSVPSFSSRGTATRRPDVAAPGVSVLGLRVPGGALDNVAPSAVVAGRFFKGTGTSQAAAVVSGAAAVLASANRNATPDQIKYALTSTASRVSGSSLDGGSGLINVARAMTVLGQGPAQTFDTGNGSGTLEGSRGTSTHVTNDGVSLTGEKDIFGRAFDSGSWAGSSWTGSSWTGGAWNGSSWTGSSWTGSSWTGSSWTGSSWTGSSWTANNWG